MKHTLTILTALLLPLLPIQAQQAAGPLIRNGSFSEGGKPLTAAGLRAQPGPHGTTCCELPAGSYRFEFQGMPPEASKNNPNKKER